MVLPQEGWLRTGRQQKEEMNIGAGYQEQTMGRRCGEGNRAPTRNRRHSRRPIGAAKGAAARRKGRDPFSDCDEGRGSPCDQASSWRPAALFELEGTCAVDSSGRRPRASHERRGSSNAVETWETERRGSHEWRVREQEGGA